MDITAWLRSLGLEQYEPAFRENDVDAGVLPRLTSEDLKDIGVTSVGHRRRMLDAIAVLQEEPGDRAAASQQAPTAAAVPSAERRQLTIMFVDLVGSSALSGRLDPEQMREVIRAYQNAVAGEITRFEGSVAKYMGDGVLAYFGYPRAHEDDAERAVLAGLSAIQAISRLRTPDGEALAVRIGIATGLVVIGDLIGEGAAREEAVVGETPNLAARLQTLSSPNELLIGPITRRLVGGAFELEELGPQALKGFAAPVPVQEPVNHETIRHRKRVNGPNSNRGRLESDTLQ
jgi:class 3 adenylate cyclase